MSWVLFLARVSSAESGQSQRYWSAVSSENPIELGTFSLRLPDTRKLHCHPARGRPQLTIKQITWDASESRIRRSSSKQGPR